MTPSILLILCSVILLVVGYQLWTMVASARSRGSLLPKDAKAWRRLGSDALTLLIGGYALMTLERNYRQPLERMERIDSGDIRSIRFRDSRSGDLRSLAQWEGRWVILNAWATWCPPCRREMPALETVQHTAGPDGVTVIALSDEDPATVETYLAAHPLNLTIGTLLQMPKALAGIGTRPYSMLIAPDGRVIEKVVGARGEAFFQAWAEQGKR